MENNLISVANLDALQRNNFPVSKASEDLELTNILFDQRKLFHLSGVGYWQEDKPAAHLSRNSEFTESPLEDLLVGMYSRQSGLAFLLEGGEQGVSVYLGVWGDGSQQTEEKTLISMLQGLFPSVQIEPAFEKSLVRYPRAGFVLGVPTLGANEKHQQGSEIDRIVRGMSGEKWACLLLAQPIPETNINALRNQVMNDIRQVEANERSSGSSTPLADLYLEHLKTQLGDLTVGLALGSWRTAAYLMGSESGYPRLAALWRGTFSGSKSIREPIRCFESEPVGRWAVKWALPDEPGTSYHHPNLFQTWLTSTQLAAFTQFPQNETLGFTVRVIPRFDVVPVAPRTARTIFIGKVKEILRTTTVDYAVDVDSLTRHALVAGVTGSGKTNTLFHLLTQINSQSIPFLILEPSKAEYRALLSNPDLAVRLRVYTPGEERVSPLRLNPFEVVDWPRNSVGVHIDLLRSVFVASFGMWTPLPQILEQCLHAIYEDRGWDITTNTNHRMESGDESSAAFPTLTELSIKVDEYTRQLGYDEKVTADLRAALLTRINGLRIGGKGWMFDSQHSTPMRSLLSQSSIMELQNMGDDDDKAFFMGLLLIRLVEHRRAEGDSHNQLRHLLVIEEAHRLLSNVSARASEEQANPRGKAVETFANLLSEIRAYGQGVVIIDQIPVKLSPDAVKNTNLKIVHRIVSAEDRQTLAGSMAMPEEQSIRFSTLTLGEAAVFRDGEDAPLIIQIPPAKGLAGQAIPTDEQLAEQMKFADHGKTTLAQIRPYSLCQQSCDAQAGSCHSARRLAEDPNIWRVFCRLVQSALNDISAMERLWGDLETAVQNRTAFSVISRTCLLTHLSQRFAARRGAQAGWSYTETQKLTEQLHKVLLAKQTGQTSLKELSQLLLQGLTLYQKNFQPCAACERVHGVDKSAKAESPVCLYRMAVDDLVAAGTFNASFMAAEQTDLASEDKRRRQTWEVCQDAGYELIEFGEDAMEEQQSRIIEQAKRCCLCFGQQMLVKNGARSPRIVSRILERLVSEAKDEF